MADSPSDVSVAESRDPVLDLGGWNAEPELLKYMGLYAAECVLELACIGLTMYLAAIEVRSRGAFIRLLIVPTVILVVKLLWIIRLACAYRSLRNARDGAAMLARMRLVHSRSVWSCSATMFGCFSCLLMVWYSLVFLLVAGYDYEKSEALAVHLFLLLSAGGFVVNLVFWRDFVQRLRKKQMKEEPTEMQLVQRIFSLYKTKAITRSKLKDLKAECLEKNQEFPIMCAICLEEFVRPSENLVRLQCGHIFHPVCAHKWICVKWSCPLRCELEALSGLQAPPSATGVVDVEASSIGRRASDLEEGGL